MVSRLEVEQDKTNNNPEIRKLILVSVLIQHLHEILRELRKYLVLGMRKYQLFFLSYLDAEFIT